MNSSTFKFTLDLRTTQSQVALPVMLGDTARELHISLCDGATPYHIVDGCLAMLVIARPNGAILEAFCMIEGNAVIKYKFDQKTAIVEGLHDCQVILVSADGEIAGTAKFSMVVSGRVYNKDDIEITDEDYIAIDAILAKEAERVDAEKDRVLADFNRESNEAVRQANETERRAKEAERQDEEESRRISETTRQEQEDERQYRYDEIGKTLEEAKNYIHIAPRHITSIDTIYDSVDDIPSEAGVYVVKGASGTPASLYEYEYWGAEFVCNLQHLGLYLVTSGEKQGLYYCTSTVEALFMPATASSGGGKDASIEISEDGYWVINGEKTEYKAVGEGGGGSSGGNVDTEAILTEAKEYTDTKIEEALSSGGSSGGGKLYRHDIYAYNSYNNASYVYFTMVNNDPTNYTSESVYDEDTWEQITEADLTPLISAFDSSLIMNVRGLIDPHMEAIFAGTVDSVSTTGYNSLKVEGISVDPTQYFMYWDDIGQAYLNPITSDIQENVEDTVTEITL